MPITREDISSAVRFWEIGRVPYNFILAAGFVLISFGMQGGLDGVRAMTAVDWASLFVLAVIANALYCLAYPMDLLFQASRWAGLWRRLRPLAWFAGLFTALYLTALVSFVIFVGFGDF